MPFLIYLRELRVYLGNSNIIGYKSYAAISLNVTTTRDYDEKDCIAMRRAADFSITDEAEKDDHESLAEKSIMTATKYKEEAKLEIEKL